MNEQNREKMESLEHVLLGILNAEVSSEWKYKHAQEIYGAYLIVVGQAECQFKCLKCGEPNVGNVYLT